MFYRGDDYIDFDFKIDKKSCECELDPIESDDFTLYRPYKDQQKTKYYHSGPVNKDISLNINKIDEIIFSNKIGKGDNSYFLFFESFGDYIEYYTNDDDLRKEWIENSDYENIISNIDDPYIKSIMYLYLAQAYFKSNQIDNYNRLLNQSIDYSLKIKDIDKFLNIYSYIFSSIQ